MMHINWKWLLGLLIGLIVVIAADLRFTIGVRPFMPPTGRQISTWGILDDATAQKPQAILDEDVNLLKVPGLQAFVHTPDGKTWSGTSGTIDLARQVLMQRDDILRVGSVTKTFTGVIVLKLIQEGRLGLDDLSMQKESGMHERDLKCSQPWEKSGVRYDCQ